MYRHNRGTMDDIFRFTAMVEKGHHFALSRFDSSDVDIVRGGQPKEDQPYSRELAGDLKEALCYTAVDYWTGLPCPRCCSKQRIFAEDLLGEGQRHVTLAPLFRDMNRAYFRECFLGALNGRKVVWIGNQDHTLQEFEAAAGLSRVDECILIPAGDAYSIGKVVQKAVDSFRTNSVVLLSCGALSCVLVRKWWSQRRECTFVDIGNSLFEDVSGAVKEHCPVCNSEDDRRRAQMHVEAGCAV